MSIESRRDFLRKGGAAALVAVTANPGRVAIGAGLAEVVAFVAAAPTIARKALETPRIAPPQVVGDEKWIFNDSLAVHSQATFLLDAHEAFFPMIKAESRVSLVAKIAKGGLDDAKQEKGRSGDRVGIAWLTDRGIKRFMEEIKSPGYRVEPGTDLKLEAATYANSGITIYGTGGRLKLEDYQRLGLLPDNLPSGMTASQAWWAENGPGWLYYRRYFGNQKATGDIPGKEPSDSGRERFSHGAGNSYLSFKKLLFKENGNPLGDTIPDPLKKILDFYWMAGKITSNRQEAIAFSYLTEIAYEAKGTFSWDTYYALKKGRRPTEGFLDEKFWDDVNASDWGGHYGVRLYEMATEGKNPRELIRTADHSKYKNEGADPHLPPITGK